MRKQLVLAGAVLGLSAGVAQAQEDYQRYYVGPSQGGFWSDPANWAVSADGTGGAGVPVAGEGLPFDGSQSGVVLVNQSTELTIDTNYGSASLVTFDMTAGRGAALAVTQMPGTITARGSTMDSSGGGIVNYVNLGGRQIATEPAGVISLAESAGSKVSYRLENNGMLRSGNLYVGKGGEGTLNQLSGSVGASTNLYVGYGAGASGTYMLGGGGLVAGGEIIGMQGTGLFRQTGGVNTAEDEITIGTQGVYDLSGGTLRADDASIEVKPGGVFRQSGGTATARSLTGGGAVELSGEGRLVVGSSHVGSLAIGGTATLDIGMGMLTVDTGGVQAIREMAGMGRLTSSMMASAGVWGIGYAASGAQGAVARCTLLGDTNLNGEIDADDYAAIDAGSLSGAGVWSQGDFNYDGVVDRADYLLIDRSWIWQEGALPPEMLAERKLRFGMDYAAELGVTVPEPGAIGLAIGAMGLLIRRRR